jgi:hypothetical protein
MQLHVGLRFSTAGTQCRTMQPCNVYKFNQLLLHLQIRRYVYCDVVRACDMSPHLDISGVQVCFYGRFAVAVVQYSCAVVSLHLQIQTAAYFDLLFGMLAHWCVRVYAVSCVAAYAPHYLVRQKSMKHGL